MKWSGFLEVLKWKMFENAVNILIWYWNWRGKKPMKGTAFHFFTCIIWWQRHNCIQFKKHDICKDSLEKRYLDCNLLNIHYCFICPNESLMWLLLRIAAFSVKNNNYIVFPSWKFPLGYNSIAERTQVQKRKMYKDWAAKTWASERI